MTAPLPRPHWLPALALLLVGAALRLLFIDSQPLSGDEAYSVVIWVQTPPERLLGAIALSTTEPHPPLALLALHGWARLAGDSVLALRWLAALFSLVALAAAYRIARRLGGSRAGWIALGILAISPYQIHYGQFARNYSLWMAGSALSLWFLLRGWDQPKRIAGWIPYVIAAILTGYVFYLEAFVWVAHNLFALAKVWKRRDLIPYWAATQIALGAALAPWYLRPELRANSRDYVPNGWPANPLWGLQTLLVGDFFPRGWQHPEMYLPEHSFGIAALVTAIIVMASLIIVRLTARRETFWFALITGLVPITLLALLSLLTGRSYFHPRYLAANAIPLTIAIGLGIDGLPRLPALPTLARRAMGWTMGGAVGMLCLIGLWHYRFDPAFARGPDWIAVMRVLDAQTTPDDLILHNYPDPAFGYYIGHAYGGPARYEVMPTAANEPYKQVAAQMDTLAAGHDTIWFIPVPYPWWDGEQQVARWLNENRQPVSDQWIGVTRLYQFAEWQASEDEIGVALAAEFEGVATLAGYRLTPPLETWEPGMAVAVELFWRPLGQTDQPLKVFVHLLGPPRPDGSILWAQDDDYPQGGRLSTQTWQPGPLWRDAYRLTLPANLVAGEYRVVAGFYDPETGQRVALAGTGEDSATLFAFSLP